jgi:Zn-dependent peptidase ImmA (M78 family)/DNA-binding XRE family transcriptional regulator
MKDYTAAQVLAFNLKRIRKRLNLSQAGLALNMGVSPQTIYKIEAGELNPTTETLLKFRKAGISIEDLLDEDTVKANGIDDLIVQFEFREGGKLTDETKTLIKRDTLEKLHKLLKLEDLTGRKVKFKNPLESKSIKNVKQAEEAAKVVRKKWQIFDNAIQNVIALLELKGIRVLELEYANFNGMSAWFFDVPLIVLNKNCSEVTRKRFTAFHELAHLILEVDEKLTVDAIERICDVFASTMLMPKELLVWEVGSKSNLTARELKRLKEKYGISFQAILVSSVFANLIDWNEYSERMKSTTAEPKGDFSVQEHADRMNQLIEIALNEGILDHKRADNLRTADISEVALA